jgi:cytochrome b561
VILATMLVRLGWRLGHAAPPLPAGTPRLQRLAAHATHGLLYAAILVQPVLGLVAITAFGKTLGPLPRVAHGLLSWAILAVVLLHVSAALWHHFVKRDGLLSRMAFRRDAAGA